MVEQYLFFSSTFDDRRRYSAADIAKYWRSFLSSGLIHKNGEPALRVIAKEENMTVQFDDGKALIFGHLYIKKGDLPFTLSPSSATEDRFDRIVLRLDNTRGDDDSRFIRAFLKEGTVEGPPELERTFIEDTPIIYEMSLAQIHVKAGKSFLEQSDIIDERLDESLCGLASSLVKVPTDQFQREWLEWFGSIKDATYITNQEFLRNINTVWLELANINMQMDANNMIKGGVTFGSNGFTGFGGIEIDKFKTTLVDSYTGGNDTLVVEASGLLVPGMEVTIYDDTNLERTTILGVADNILTIGPLQNDYEASGNVARTMFVLDEERQEVKFGSFGTLENKTILGEEVPNLTNIYSFTSLSGEIFFAGPQSVNQRILRRNQDGSYEYVTLATPVREYSTITSNGKYLVYIRRDVQSTNVYSHTVVVIDREGNRLMPEKLIVGTSYASINNFYWDGDTIYIKMGYYSQSKEVFKVDITATEVLVESVVAKGSMGGGTLINVLPESAIVQYSTQTDRVTFQIHTASALTTKILMEPDVIAAYFFKGRYYVIAYDKATTIYVHSSEDLGIWDKKAHPINQVLTTSGMRVQIDKMGSVIITAKSGNNLVYSKKEAVDSTFSDIIVLGDYSANYNINVNAGETIYGLRLKGPLASTMINGMSPSIYASLIYGVGEAINVNDIRFRVGSFESLAVLSKSTEDISLISATIGDTPMDIENMSSQQQAIGRALERGDHTVRLTFFRDQVENDSYLHQIIGGRE